LEQVEDGKEILLARGRKPVARLIACSESEVQDRPKVGETTSKPLKIKEQREVAGRIGDTVVYF
jgi:antitoxin (DNA-binding transcriptional repressor) of toxin-antitoxin stability system